MTDESGMKLKRKILIMGLPGSGKTTIAELLVPRLKAVWFNADAVRQEINKDLGFDEEARLEHARRMGVMCDFATRYGGYAVADFVCPTKATRENFDADFVVWMDTIKEGRFEDTNKLFQNPKKVDFHITEWNEKNHNDVAKEILKWKK